MSPILASAEAAPSILWQGIAFIIGLPLVYIALGEITHRLRSAGNPFCRVLWATRTLALPPLAIWIVAHHFFGANPDGTALRLVQSAFWIGVAIGILLFLGTLVSHGKPARNWQVSMPNLLFQFLRAAVVFAALTYLLAAVWKIDVTKIMGTLGIGSLVIALALQDTLSNLVSGFLLIIEGPFKVGDWIKVGAIEGEVIEINWRAVRIRTIDRDVVIIPNGNLGKENICNFVLNDPLHAIRLKMDLSSADHPDLVQQTLVNVMRGIDGILASPEPEVDPMEYKNTSIRYEVRFFITDYAQAEPISDEFLRRAYYAIRRAGLSFPYAERIEQREVSTTMSNPNVGTERLVAALKKQPLFTHLDETSILWLADATRCDLFGVGENIVRTGMPDEAFFVILAGKVGLVSAQSNRTIAHLSEGDFVGEMVLLSGDPSLITATVEETATVLRIESTAINQLVSRLPRFALEISQFIDERRKLIRSAS